MTTEETTDWTTMTSQTTQTMTSQTTQSETSHSQSTPELTTITPGNGNVMHKKITVRLKVRSHGFGLQNTGPCQGTPCTNYQLYVNTIIISSTIKMQAKL